MTGYFRIYRDTLHCSVMKNRDMLQVWIFLCEQMRFKETIKDGVEILPGQVLISAGEIARLCTLKTDRVQYILRCLEKNGMILRKNIRNRYSLITVLEPTETREPVPAAPIQPPQRDVEIQTAQTAEAAPTYAAADTQKQPENEKKSSFGLFGNVYLTAQEKQMLADRCAAADLYIDNLSAYKRRTHKEYTDDFSVLCEWISKDDINEKRSAAKQAALQLRREKEKTAKENDPAQPCAKNHFMPGKASYDLEAAEKRAHESVPKLKKRRRLPHT